jgi:hypothetical protein
LHAIGNILHSSLGGLVTMNVKILVFCVGCMLVLVTTGTAAEQSEAPAILSALGAQSGITVVTEADLAEIEGTGPLGSWGRQWRARLRTFFRVSQARRRAIIRARIAYWRGGGAETPDPGGETGGGEMPPE